MNKYTNYRQKSKRKTWVVVIFIVILASLVAGIIIVTNKKTQNSSANPVETTDTINFSPPTADEENNGDEKKDDITKPNQTSNTNNTNAGTQQTKKGVTPIIVNAEPYGSVIEVSGYVDKIIESGGTCTARLTKGSTVVTESQKALEDAQNTSCGVIEVPKSKLSSGTWSVSLEYSSTKYAGTSATQKLTL